MMLPISLHQEPVEFKVCGFIGMISFLVWFCWPRDEDELNWRS